MKLENEIKPKSDLKKLLYNNTFIIVLSRFLKNNYENQDIDEKYFNIVNNIELYTSNEFFLLITEFFSDQVLLASFLDDLKEYSFLKDEDNLKLLNVFLDALDYSLEVYKNNSKYPENFNYIGNSLKIKVDQIIGREINNVTILLQQKGFPVFTDYNLLIINADFDNPIDYNGIEYIRCQDSEGQYFYMNISGNILLNNNDDVIEKIYYTFYLGETFVSSYLTVKGDRLVTITNTKNKVSLSHYNAYASLNSVYFDEDSSELQYIFIKEYKQGLDGNEDGDFSIENTNPTYLLNENLDRLNLFDILVFLREENRGIFNSNKFKQNYLYDIYRPFYYNGKKYIKVKANLEGKVQDFIIGEDGNVLRETIDKLNGSLFIKELYDVENILGKDFLMYGLQEEEEFLGFDMDTIDGLNTLVKDKIVNINSHDGLIDRTGKVLKIRGKKVLSIKKFHLKVSNNGVLEDTYILNGDKLFTISESSLRNHLSGYVGFNEEIDEIDLDIESLDENGRIFGLVGVGDIEGDYIEKIIGKINNNGELEIYVKKSGKIKIVDYDKLIKKLSLEVKYKDLLALLESHIERISNM